MFMAEARHFVACVTGSDVPESPLEDGVAVLRLALAVKASMASGRPQELN